MNLYESFWNHQIIAWSLVVLGAALVLFFGFNAIQGFLQVQLTGLEPGTTDPANIRGWMTVPYIARAYEVPEKYIFRQINIPAEGNRNRSLKVLNRRYAPGEPEEIPGRVREAIRNYQRTHPPDASNNG